MRLKFLSALVLTAVMSASAQGLGGYKDGIVYFKADQFDKAQKILNNTLNDAGTDKGMANYYLGAIDLRNGNLQQAKAAFDRGIAAAPTNAYNFVGLGQLDLMQGNVQGAEQQFKQAQNLAKKDAAVLVLIARAYYKADPVKYAKEVEKYLLKARKQSKNHEPSIYILEGDMAIDQDQPGEAAQSYEQAIFFDEGNPEGYVKYAKAYIHVNPDFAIAKLEELNQKHPDMAIAQSELAERLYDNDQWTRAAEVYGKYIQNPNHFPEDKVRYSVLLYYGKKYPESLKVVEDILRTDPNNFQANRIKMLDYSELKDNEKAVEAAEKFLSIGGHYTGNDYTTYGDALTALDQDSLALVAYEKAVEAAPDNATMLEYLSTGYNNLKQYDKAAEAIDRYMTVMGDKATATDQAMAAGRWLIYSSSITEPEARLAAGNRGVEYIDLALAQAPHNTMLLKRKAQLLFTAANNTMTPEAAQAFEALVAQLDTDANNKTEEANSYALAYKLLINYYQGTGDKDRVAQLFQLLQEVEPQQAQ